MTTVACIIIAGGTREQLLDDKVLPSVLGQCFDEVVVVGQHRPGEGYRYLEVPALTHTTVDALVKRDVGTVATTSDILVYLSDDHALLGPVAATLRRIAPDIVVPARFADHPELGRVRIPNGEEGNYCAGHCGVFRRWVIQDRPWTAQPHHRNWDLLASHNQRAAGWGVHYSGDTYCFAILDLQPEREPWT